MGGFSVGWSVPGRRWWSRRWAAVLRRGRLLGLTLAVWPLWLGGCGADFDPYNLLKTFRVLAVRADRPTLAAGETAALDALTFTPTAGAAVSYNWSWCPVTTSRAFGTTCAITQAEFQALMDSTAAALGEATVALASFDMGQAATASFAFQGTAALWQGVCASLQERSKDRFAEVFSCDGGFPITIRLEASSGDESIAAIKIVTLLFDAANANQNPTLDALRGGLKDASETEAVAWEAATAATVKRETDYRLYADIPASAVEMFTPLPTAQDPTPSARKEDLLVSWFFQEGSTRVNRTRYLPLEEDNLDTVRMNDWTPPDTETFGENQMRVFVVIRDGRGGVGWLERLVSLEAP